MRPSEARVFWKALMDNASALIISPHSLRHASITNALDAGVPLRDAQILARHADLRTTPLSITTGRAATSTATASIS